MTAAAIILGWRRKYEKIKLKTLGEDTYQKKKTLGSEILMGGQDQKKNKENLSWKIRFDG